MYRPYAYDVTEGRPPALGVKRGTATCVIAKHAARGATPALPHRRAGPPTERLSANAHCQHNTCALRDTSLASLLWRRDPLWRQCIRSIVFLKIFVYITNGELCTHDMVQLPTCEGDIRISQNLMKTLKNHISWMGYPFLSKFWMFIAKKYSTFNEFIFFSEYSVLLSQIPYIKSSLWTEISASKHSFPLHVSWCMCIHY